MPEGSKKHNGAARVVIRLLVALLLALLFYLLLTRRMRPPAELPEPPGQGQGRSAPTPRT